MASTVQWDPIFRASEQKYGLPSGLLGAIAKQENVAEGHFNPLGLSDDSGVKTFTPEEAPQMIDRQARLLTNPNGPYKDFVRTGSIQDLAKVYSPVGASNDVHGTNSTEAFGILSNLLKGGQGQQSAPLPPPPLLPSSQNTTGNNVSIPDSLKPFIQSANQLEGKEPEGNYLPYAPDIKIGSQADVKEYDNFVNNGGDPNSLSLEARLGVAVAKDPKLLTRPENADLYNKFVLEPRDSNYNVWDAAGKALAAAPGGLWNAYKEATGSYVGNALEAAGDYFESKVKAVTGWGWSGRTQDQINTSWGQHIANSNGAWGQIGADAVGIVENPMAYVLGASGKAAIDNMPAGKAKEDAIADRVSLLQGVDADNEARATWAKATQAGMANFYKTVQGGYSAVEQAMGLHGTDQGTIDRGATFLGTTPTDPAVLRGGSTLAQIGLPEAAGNLAVRIADSPIKPLMTEQALYQAEKAANLSGKTAAANLIAIGDRGVDNAAQGVARDMGNQLSQANADAANSSQQLSNFLKTPNTVSNVAGTLMKAAGQSSLFASKVAGVVSDLPGRVSELFTRSLPEGVVQNSTRAAIKGVVDTAIKGMAFTHGPIAFAAAMGGPIAKSVLETGGQFLTASGKELMHGLASIPYWQRVGSSLEGGARGVAMALDKPLIYTAGDMVKGGLAGAATGAAMGLNPVDPAGGATSGSFMGGIMGMAGAGLGQMQKFQDPNAFVQATKGDWLRYRSMLGGEDRANFDKLTPENQVALSSFIQQFPGLRVNFFNKDGAASSHTVNADGTSVVNLNVANGSQTLAPLIAHELGHNALHNGIMPDVYDALLGNPDKNKIGQYTELDAAGKPTGVDPATGRYNTNQDWQNLTNEYVNKLGASVDENGRPIVTDHLTPHDIAKEIWAEHGADYLLSGSHMLNARSAWSAFPITNQFNAKQAMMKLGGAFTTGGDVVRGSGLFNNLQRNPEIDRLLSTYTQIRNKEGLDRTSEEAVTHKFSDNDLRNQNITGTFLDSVPELKRNPDGSLVRDVNGRPVWQTKGEVRQTARNMANTAMAMVTQLPEDQRAEIGHIQKGDNHFVRYFPDHIVDAIIKQNQNNSVQADNFRMMNKNLADLSRSGQEYNIFYHKAVQSGRYGQFAGASRDIIPYGWEFTKDGNINYKTVDMAQLTNNFLRNQGRVGVKGLWTGAQDFMKDADTYFRNHAQGLPGETNLGVDKKNAINGLAKLGTNIQAEHNPLVDRLPGNNIIKSFRLDRTNRVRPLDQVGPPRFTDLQQYSRINTNYRPALPEGAKIGDSLGNEGHPEALDAIVANPKAKDPIAKVDYGIVNSPLLGSKRDVLSNITDRTKVPQNIDQGRMDSQFGFLNKTEKNKLQVLAGNGSVKKFGDTLANWMLKQISNPDIAAGMGWYTRMRQRIAEVFPDPAKAERFTQLLGATSAQTPVDDNFMQAVDAHEQAEKGLFDNHVAEYQKALDIQAGGEGKLLQHSLDNGHNLDIVDKKGNVIGQRAPETDSEAMAAYLKAHNAIPLRSNGKKFNANSMQVLKVLHGSWLDDVQAPKTPNFAGNLSGRTLQATIDVWAARAMRRLGYEGFTDGAPWRILPKAEAGVGNLDFAFSQLAMEHAAKQLGMNPDDFQAVAWFAEKHHWDDRGWTSDAGTEKSSFDKAADVFFPQNQAPRTYAQGSAIMGLDRAQRGLAANTARFNAADRSVDPNEYKNARAAQRSAAKKLQVAQTTYDAIMKSLTK